MSLLHPMVVLSHQSIIDDDDDDDDEKGALCSCEGEFKVEVHPRICLNTLLKP
jgi:hypothetical protein